MEFKKSENNLNRISKWQFRVDFNNIMKSQRAIVNQSPTVDEWLNRKLTKKRSSMNSRLSN